MNLTDIEALLRVVEHGSFQGAAATHRVSRSALRRQVERLEKEIGVPLLDRQASGVALTPAGQTVVSRALPLLREARAMRQEARDARDDARGRLRLVVPAGLPVEPRTRALLTLRSLHPDLDISVVESDDPLCRIGEPFDLMFHLGQAPDRRDWYSHVVARLPCGLRATPAYLKQHGHPESLDALAQHTLLQWSPPGVRDEGLPIRGGGAAKSTPWLRTANLPMLIHLAQANVGIAYLVSFGEEGPLVPVLEGVVGGTVTLRALSPRPGRADPKVRALLKNIQRILAQFSPAR